MNEFSGMLCLGGVLLAPLFAFVFGFLLGRNRLPYTVRIEKRKQDAYAVDHGEDWESNLNP